MDASASEETVDSRGITFWRRQRNDQPLPTVLGSPESEAYSMKYPARGKCLIFNQERFDPYIKRPTREGTDMDAAALRKLFESFNFDVIEHKDLKVRDIESKLKEVSKMNHADNDCFVCCMLSHGGDGTVLGYDGIMSTEKLFSPFDGISCPSLAGKPKMFFVQACRGDKLDGGVSVKLESADSAPVSKIPSQADFLIAYSTVPGYSSWRNGDVGSWFIQSVCDVFQENAGKMDVLEMLTLVSRRVAYECESCTPNYPSMSMKKQVPCIVSTLTRKIYLTPKF